MQEILLEHIKSLFEELGRFLIFTWKSIKYVFKKPYYTEEILYQMKWAGVESVLLIVLTGFFLGLITALQVGKAMESLVKGAEAYIGGLISVSLIKEMGPIFTAIGMISRVGSATAAQLGTMKVTEQVDALEVMSIEPINFLVKPRLVAFALMGTILNVFTITAGLIGGYFVATTAFEVGPALFWSDAFNVLSIGDIIESQLKAFTLGAAIALVSAYTGLNVKRGAKEVGKATTRAVVFSIVLILFLDYLIAATILIVKQFFETAGF